MIGILASLFFCGVDIVGGIYNDIQNEKSKRSTYNPRTGTYIDYRGCTRDIKTNEYRNPTGQWNAKKKRYENIILGPGGKIVRNLTEEEDQRREAADWKMKVHPDDTEDSFHNMTFSSGEQALVKGILYKGKVDNDYYVNRTWLLHMGDNQLDNIVHLTVSMRLKDRRVTIVDMYEQAKSKKLALKMHREAIEKNKTKVERYIENGEIKYRTVYRDKAPDCYLNNTEDYDKWIELINKAIDNDRERNSMRYQTFYNDGGGSIWVNKENDNEHRLAI